MRTATFVVCDQTSTPKLFHPCATAGYDGVRTGSMLSRLKTAAQGGPGTTGDDSAGTSKADRNSKWGRRGGGGKPAERDQFRVQQQGFYVRGDLTVDVFQARGLRLGSATERNPYCVVLVDRVKVGETPTASKTVSPVWNHPVKVSHESFRRAADTNVWPVPYQPLSVQVWDRSNTSDALLGTARVHITDALSSGDKNGWYKLVGTGDQAGVEEVCGKIRVKVHWESETLVSSPEDKPRLFLRDVFGPDQRDYQHLYYGGLSSTMLCPPAGEEALLELMMGVSRHDVTANNHGKGVEGMLVLTELRLLFLPDIGVGSTTASFLEFNTVQVYLAAVRNFSHRGLEGGDRLLSITTRDGRFVHFRMPAAASAARCGTWFDTEGPQQQRRRWRVGGGTQSSSGREELWQRGLWGAGTSELWMERLVDEIRWRKASGDFVALWHKLSETAANPRATAAATIAVPSSSSSSSSSAQPPSSSQAHHAAATASNNAAAAARLTAIRAAAAAADARGDRADGRGALQRDLERMGVPKAGGGGGASYAAFGRQMWEFKPVNKDYALSPTYPQALAFPSSITPAQLSAAAPQRSRSRVPALVWLHPASKAPLCRSSQPMAGMTTKVLSEDIHLLKQIRVTLDASKLSIVDARSLLNAKANQVTGKGYEDVNDIGRDVCTLGFMGIENIHAVRDSLASFCAASQAQGQEYFHAVGASGWLRHLSQIMKGAAFVVDELQRGIAVLVHCSDGWDRTAQLTALAQLYMDPYYRTLEGFEVLVEKEWCSFGHMFGLRAHSDSPTESSPVFLQWLDAVWQLVRQYPSSFEFTGHYLERLVEGVYSAGFLNFAGNCERERKEKLKELRETGSGALSLFTYLREHAMEGTMTAPLLNPLYRPPPYTLGGGGGRVPALRAVDVLRPCCELQGLEVWKTVYMRDNLLLHHREQQLSVEQGLRLQAYDYKRRIDLIEASMDRLPRGLRAKLRSSATGMKSPEWDRHDRLVAQLSADQDAAAAAAAAAAQASSLPGMASRGRSQSRGSRSASANANDESSRSRSRSFNLPLRGWGKGGGGGGGGVHVPDAYRIERADTDTYRNSRVDTDIEEESIRAISEGSRHQSSGGTPSRGGAEGEEEEEVGERPGRNKSFFVGLGRWGPGRRRSASTQELSSPVAGGGGGGVEKRRRNSSSAAAAAATAANTRRNSLFSSFTGERPSVAPSVDPSPDNNNQGAARRFGKKSPGAGKRKGLLKSQTMVDVPATGLRSPPPPEPLRSAKGSGGKKAWGRTSRATTAATVDVEDDLEPRQQRAKSTSGGGRPPTTTRDKRASPDARSGPGRTRWGRGRQSSSVGAEYYEEGEEDEDEDLVPRRRAQSTAGAYQASAPAAEGVGTAKKKGSSRAKGVWGSFQRTLGTGLSSKSTPDPVVQGRTGRLRRQTASPTPVEGLGTSSSSKSSSRSEKAKKSTTGRDREHPAREDAASAERVATLLKAEEDAEARRQLEHRIITLEMKLLVKDLVDTACVRAAERTSERSSERSSTRSNQSSLKWTPLSVSSSVAPAPLPRLSATAVQAERQSFFGNFWNAGGGKDGGDISNGDGGLGGGQGIGGGQTGGGIAGHWGGFDRDGARQQRNRSAAAAVSSNGIDIDSKAVWKPDGTRYLASARNQGRRGDDEWNEDGGEKKKKEEVEVDEEEEGFFQALRRKLFEGDKTSSDHKSAAAAAAAGATASEVKNESPSLHLPTPVKQTAAPVAAVGAGATGGSGSGSGSRPARRNSTPTGTNDSRPSRSKSMAAAAVAGPGKQRSSRAIMILPPPKLAERSPPANHPDAGAGGSRPVERSRAVTSAAPVPPPMAPELAEEAAAKFGLVRMQVASG